MKQMLTDNEFLDGLTNLFLREGITGLTVGEIAGGDALARPIWV